MFNSRQHTHRIQEMFLLGPTTGSTAAGQRLPASLSAASSRLQSTDQARPPKLDNISSLQHSQREKQHQLSTRETSDTHRHQSNLSPQKPNPDHKNTVQYQSRSGPACEDELDHSGSTPCHVMSPGQSTQSPTLSRAAAHGQSSLDQIAQKQPCQQEQIRQAQEPERQYSQRTYVLEPAQQSESTQPVDTASLANPSDSSHAREVQQMSQYQSPQQASSLCLDTQRPTRQNILTSPSSTSSSSHPSNKPQQIHRSLIPSRNARIRANNNSIARLNSSIEHNRSSVDHHIAERNRFPIGSLSWSACNKNVQFYSRRVIRVTHRVMEMSREVGALQGLGSEEYVAWRRQNGRVCT
jgi:hypothetical protein